MIILYGFGPDFGLPEISPFVTKTQVHLAMAGLPFEKRIGDFRHAPKGQLPYIEVDGRSVGDSTFIRDVIEAQSGVDLDAALSPVERAHAWAIERMMENHFLWAGVAERWLHPANFERGPGKWLSGAPAEFRAATQQRMRDTIHAVGIGRHNEAEIVQLAGRSLEAVSAILGQKIFLFGDRPCAADATLFAILAAALTPYFDGPIRDRAESHPNLVRYVDRMMARHFPDHPWRVG
ncbi:glutathione S-transferase family protein [Sphingobium sp. HBC34]|uniref:Glutathione S-transferase family protein n=1 Tax=Sphingobium cyanobacteriorum TaxID=3063954 RepID=A0ABT8ZS01_9SPHN|nr:glutathione S-transferase family protein [Sphingobium sp. HBC34]MDO7837315.1 glutathione S-transferase family protein [Sphingobium sp. HBC34]